MKTLMDTLNDLISQIREWPASTAMVIALNLFGWAAKKSTYIPNNLIPIFLVLMGALIYPFIGAPGDVGPMRNPDVMMAIYGSLLGFVSWAIHGIVWKQIIKRIPGADENGSTDKPTDTTQPKDK